MAVWHCRIRSDTSGIKVAGTSHLVRNPYGFILRVFSDAWEPG
jgi:hypothetical protein